MTTQSYGRSKDQRRARINKEIDHGKDINKVNKSNCIFFERFEDKRMSVQFSHLFQAMTTTDTQVKLEDLKEHTLTLINFR